MASPRRIYGASSLHGSNIPTVQATQGKDMETDQSCINLYYLGSEDKFYSHFEIHVTRIYLIFFKFANL